ncbi:MAG: hypothetical protein U0931_21115 [Vulcanimicrobiota bacterium]
MRSTDEKLTPQIETDLRNDARERFMGPLWKDTSFEDFRPAYLFGMDLAEDPRFTPTNMPELAAYAKEHWKGEYPFNYYNMRMAIEYGFARARIGSA